MCISGGGGGGKRGAASVAAATAAAAIAPTAPLPIMVSAGGGAVALVWRWRCWCQQPSKYTWSLAEVLAMAMVALGSARVAAAAAGRHRGRRGATAVAAVVEEAFVNVSGGDGMKGSLPLPPRNRRQLHLALAGSRRCQCNNIGGERDGYTVDMKSIPSGTNQVQRLAEILYTQNKQHNLVWPGVQRGPGGF